MLKIIAVAILTLAPVLPAQAKVAEVYWEARFLRENGAVLKREDIKGVVITWTRISVKGVISTGTSKLKTKSPARFSFITKGQYSFTGVVVDTDDVVSAPSDPVAWSLK